MVYPVWEPPVANSMLIAVIAIVHVFVSHFAIGGGLYLVLAETWARRKNDADHLAHIIRQSKFFLLVTIVFGAVTGVGIWVTIGLIHPVGTKWLINNFVWGWATEWVFFFVEITAVIMYYYGWKRLAAKTHLAVGWIYFIAAWMSLFIINGIITFMLTPGDWIATGAFWDGFFNPTFWPSLFLRTFICLILAGLYATFTIAKEKNIDLKIRVMRRNGTLILASLVLAVPFAWWYFMAAPRPPTGAIDPGTVTSLALQVMVFFAAVLFVLTLLGNLLFPRRAGYISAAILLLCGLMSMGGFEWAREALRKPYIIHGFLYSNNVTVAEAAELPSDQPLIVAHSTGDRGRDIFLAECRSCHTIDGYLSLADKIAGLEEEHLVNIIPRLQYFISPMPPFAGNNDDAAALAAWLKDRADADPIATMTSASDEEKAKIVYARRCGGCHVPGGFRSVDGTFEGLDAEEASEIIAYLQDLTDEMPPFAGSDEEMRLLILYLTGVTP